MRKCTPTYRSLRLLWLLLPFSLVWAACGEEPKKVVSPGNDILDDTSAYDTSHWNTDLPPDNDSLSGLYPESDLVSFEPGGVRLNTLPDKAEIGLHPSDYEILKTLFQGKIYRFSFAKQYIDMAAWSCPACDSTSVRDELGYSDDFWFPGNQNWDSRVLAKLPYVRKGEKEVAIFIESTPYEQDAVKTGRFNNPVVSVSLWKQTANGWELRYFEPAAYSMGSFGNARKPGLVGVHKDKVFFEALDYNGPAGGPFSGNLILLVADHKGVQKEYKEVNAGCLYDGFLEWKAGFELAEKEHRGFPDLILRAEGNISKTNMDELAFEYLYPEVQKKAGNRPEYHFDYERRYRWNGLDYTPGNPDIRISHLVYPVR